MLRKNLLALVGATLLAAPASAQTLDEIVSKHVTARGGLAKLKAVNSIRLTAR